MSSNRLNVLQTEMLHRYFYARSKITVTLPMASLWGGKVTVIFLLSQMDRVRYPLRGNGFELYGWRNIRLDSCEFDLLRVEVHSTGALFILYYNVEMDTIEAWKISVQQKWCTLIFVLYTKATTGYACGIKKATPMRRKDKPPKLQWKQVCRPHTE